MKIRLIIILSILAILTFLFLIKGHFLFPSKVKNSNVTSAREIIVGNKDLLKGTDQNSNGIWDDLELSIKSIGKTPEQKKALEQLYMSFQEVLLNPEKGKKLKAGKVKDDKIIKAQACMDFIWGGPDKSPPVNTWRDPLLKNKERAKAYAKFNVYLSGGTYSLWDIKELGNPCEFEVNSK